MSGSWLESSRAEISLAHNVATWLRIELAAMDTVCRVLEDLAYHLAEHTPNDDEEDDVVLQLVKRFPQLQDIDVTRPFPQHANDLTANFFGRLAHEIIGQSVEIANLGLVGTPSELALDMVAVAAAYWLEPRIGEPLQSLAAAVAGGDRRTLLFERAGTMLRDATWYDPCVGGGVFPVSILVLLHHLGMPLDNAVLSGIAGRDIEPAAVTATAIRVALFVSHVRGESYSQIRRELPCQFSVGDTLMSSTETGEGLFGMAVNGSKNLTGHGGTPFDIIVGNPPYVRANRLSKTAKNFLWQSYPSVASSHADLYNYFIAHGLLSLRDGGILCYISPASFQKSRYGRGTRRFIRQQGTVEAVFDFNELPVFVDANIHTSVYIIRKGMAQGPAYAHVFDTLPETHPLLRGLALAVVMPSRDLAVDGWHLGSSETEAIVDMLCRNSIPLKQYAGQILSGIKTGHKEAFFIGIREAKRLAMEETARPYIKPMLRPVSIRRWRSKWDGSHLLLIKKGEELPENSAILERLRMHEDALRARSDIQGHPTWYGLRACGYYDAFERPKIIFPDIASQCRFAIDTEGYFIPDGAFIIPAEDYFLVGIMNSCVGRFYFRARCNSIGNVHNGGRLRFKKTYVEAFPVPRPSDETAAVRSAIEQLSRALVSETAAADAETQIDRLTLQLYHVPENQWDVFLEGEMR